MNFDHILMIGFGGPTRMEEVKPFLEQVTRGRNIPEARLAEVVHHYEKVGGFSPYNAFTFQLAEKLKKNLEESGVSLPFYTGMRNWHPFLEEVLREIKAKGLRKGLGIILAPHRSEASFERYLSSLQQAKEKSGARDLEYEFIGPWHDHPLFAEAQAQKVRAVLNEIDPELKKQTVLLFSAHSIPTAMAQACQYEQEYRISCENVLRLVGGAEWRMGYQSRSGSPREPWLGPEVNEVLHEIKNTGKKAAVLIPVGFLCDNVEVLYDLDIEARQEAQKTGLVYFRAGTVCSHPCFVEMLKTLVRKELVPKQQQLSNSL